MNKEEILTEYSNRISYGRLSFGLASAAKSYFGVSPKNLTDAQSLALIVMAKNPRAYDPILEEENFRKRFISLAEKLESDGEITPAKKEEILAEKLSFPKPKNPLPYGVDAYKKLSSSEMTDNQDPETSGQPVKTTLSLSLTKRIESIASGILANIAWKNVSDYSVLLMDRETLQIRVLIG